MSFAYGNFVGRRVYECSRFLEKTQWLKKRDLEVLRLRNLRALVRHAYDNVPYYHDVFRRNNFRPDDLKCFADLHKLPILKKSTIRHNLDRLIARNVASREFVFRKTSGTTAAPVKMVRDRMDVSWGIGAELRAYRWAGYELGDRLGLVWNFSPERFNSFWFSLERIFGRYRVLHLRDLSESAMSRYADVLESFKPDFIKGNAAGTNIFAGFLLRNGNSWQIRPRAVLTSCETLLPHYRRSIEKAFNCDVYDYYATSELSHIGAQCGCNAGLHVFCENVGFEIVRDGELATEGEDGLVLLTNLHNYAMPLIRYEIGDFGHLLGEDCQCGRSLPLFNIRGRTLEYFVCSDGSFTFLFDFQRLFEDLPIEDFQVVQEGPDDILLKIVPRPGYGEKHTGFISRNIKVFGNARVRIELVDRIHPGKTGKVRHIVSKITTSYT